MGIAGGLVGGFIVLLIIALVVLCFLYKKRRTRGLEMLVSSFELYYNYFKLGLVDFLLHAYSLERPIKYSAMKSTHSIACTLFYSCSYYLQ